MDGLVQDKNISIAQLILLDSWDLFTHIIQGCFTSTGVTAWLRLVAEGYQTKSYRDKARTVFTFLVCSIIRHMMQIIRK